MTDYYEIRKSIIKYLNENQINAYDLVRVSKDLCSCSTCKYFIQHYSKDGKPLDFGHCVKSNIPKSKKPSMQSCGSWTLDE